MSGAPTRWASKRSHQLDTKVGQKRRYRLKQFLAASGAMDDYEHWVSRIREVGWRQVEAELAPDRDASADKELRRLGLVK